MFKEFEPPHDKTNEMARLRSAWASAQSDKSLCCTLHPSFLHVDTEDSDQTRRMPRLIWVIAGHTCNMVILSWDGSFIRTIWADFENQFTRMCFPGRSDKHHNLQESITMSVRLTNIKHFYKHVISLYKLDIARPSRPTPNSSSTYRGTAGNKT